METAVKYDVVTPAPRVAGHYDTIAYQLVALTGCELEEAINAYLILKRLGDARRRIGELSREIAALEGAARCNGWMRERGDGRLYVHHSAGASCPHPEHGGGGRVRKYVSAENLKGWKTAVVRQRRLEAARVELVNVECSIPRLAGLLQKGKA